MMTVKLSSRGNGTQMVEVEDYATASKVVRQYITQNGLGVSVFTGGQVYVGRKMVAIVSYNGKVWPPQAWTPGMKPLI
jgi:hypothetical protein